MSWRCSTGEKNLNKTTLSHGGKESESESWWCAVPCSCVAHLSWKKDLFMGESWQPPAVAACITGHVRTLSITASNIFETMIAPIRDHVDVFSALSPMLDDRYPPRNATHPKYQSQTGPRKNSTTTVTKDRIEQWMHIFSPISVDVETTTNENEGLHRCFQKVQRRERERHSLYRFLLRLRPDVAYQTRLPEWPAWWNLVRHAESSLALTDVSSPSTSCFKDVWSLMTRAAAAAYFAPSWPPPCAPRTATAAWLGTAECSLGCALHRANVTAVAVPLQRLIVRQWHGSSQLPESTASLPRLAWDASIGGDSRRFR